MDMEMHDSAFGALQHLVDRLKASSNIKGILIEILEHEHLAEELLAVCQKDPYYVQSHYKQLVPKYKQEVSALFLKLIRPVANSARNRKEYQRVCGIIKGYKNACGASYAGEIITELRTGHPGRPAFLDELSKIK
jgi:hypothetical protein